ncbi:TP901 family phage tail tape measure protein [Paenibacillus turicensis]|uniref:TP901 family phage tail tape measure protein n=1 Tax=Paenibacillus turicensis TaxID=160487 RepID=A0ABS4FX24_9BACL|nr:phage tail tape measure protein [Paenibacillus turicensis]MBP1907074.1 TP901 family phage tail tape measure protein [Paenibacillus turicensis]
MSENIEVAGLVTRIAIDDTGLEKTLSGLDRQMKLVKSEFDKGSSILKAYGNDTESLKLKSDALSKQMEVQNARVSTYQAALQKSKDNMTQNSQAAEALKQRIAETQAAYEASAKATGKESEESQKLKTELSNLNQEYQKTAKSVESNSRSVDDNTIKANKAQTEYNRLASQLNSTNAEIAKQESGWQKLSQTLDGASKKLKSVGDAMSTAGQTLTMTVTAPLAAAGGLATKAAIDYETAFAGIRKTVDATEAQFSQLSTGIRNMAKEIPVAATEIARVGEAAGQLGIKTENILGFSRTMVDLGVATNMSSDQAATALARLANITQMPQNQFDKLGATIVALGNNLATTESEIVEMGLRIAGAGNIVGLSEAQILSLGGALSSVGIEAEAGGTAISKLMINLASAVNGGGKELERFAAVAGMTSAQFTAAFKDNAAEAIVTFIEGLGKINDAGGNTFGVIDALGLSEIRLRDALLRSAGAGDVMRDSLELGNQAWEENVALTNEAEQRYQTTASQLQIFKNRLTDIGITLGDALIPALLKLLDSLQPLIDQLAAGATWFSKLDDSTRNTIVTIAGVTAAIGPTLLVFGKLSTSIGNMIGLFSKFSGATAAASIASKTAAASTAALSGAAVTSVGGLTGAAKAANVLQFAVKGLLGPVGVAITALSALAAVFAYVRNQMQPAIPTVQQFGAQSESAMNKASGSFERFRASTGKSLGETTKTVDKNAKAIGDSIVNSVDKGTKKAAGAAKKNLDKMTDDLKDQVDKMKEIVSKGTDTLNKLGDAIVTALKKQYEEQEKAQTAAIDKKIEAEKKVSESVTKNLDKELENRTKALDKQNDAEKKASDARLKIYDQEYNQKLKLIDEDLYNQVKGLQDQIDGIDAQTDAEEKAAKEQEHQAKVAELNKQLLAAETAEERAKIQADLSKVLADYDRAQLLEQRKAQKDGLKSQIDAAKEVAAKKKEQLKIELDNDKEREKERLTIYQEGLSNQKTALKDHYTDLKEKEKERTESVQTELTKQKESVKEHFDELTKTENLQAEARKMIIGKQNDDIIKLLKTYNPKWQDAGQSFADAFKNGLNSEMKSMSDAVKEAVNIAPIIDDQVRSLTALEDKLKAIQSKTSSAGGGGGGGGGIAGIGAGFDAASLSADNFTDSVVNGVVPAMDNLGDSAEGVENEVVNAFLGLRNKAMTELYTLQWSGRAVTQETAASIADTFFAMGDQVTAEMTKDHEEQLSQMQIFLANSKELTEAEKEEALQRLKDAQALQAQEVEAGQKRVAEIMSTALDEKRGITEKEYTEIMSIQERLTTDAVRVMTNNVDEQKALYERLKREASDLSAQQAATVVQNSIKQRDETVKTAENQYQTVVAQIVKQRDEMGTISAEQAEKLINEAKRQRDETVKRAEEMHSQVVGEAKKQAEAHVNQVNWETGEILSKWDAYWKSVGKVWTGIYKDAEKTFGDMWSSVTTTTTKIKDDVLGIWDEVVNFFKGIDLSEIGSNIMGGLASGMTKSTDNLKNVARQAAKGISKEMRSELQTRSPSRVTMKIGKDVGEGLVVGLKSKLSGIEAQSRKMASAAVPAMESLEFSPSGAISSSATLDKTTSDTYNFDGMFRDATFVVRSDDDIRRLGQGLGSYIINNARGLGGAK